MAFSSKGCPVCGAPLHGRADKTFCSVACRVRAHRNRHAEPDEQSNHLMARKESVDNRFVARDEFAVVVQQTIPHLTERTEQPQLSWQEQLELEWQQESESVLALEIHAYYSEAIEALLQHENQRLSRRRLEELLALVMDSLEEYKCHPHLRQAESVARKRVNDLRDAVVLLNDVLLEAKGNWLENHKAGYLLSDKWRRKLRSRLIA